MLCCIRTIIDIGDASKETWNIFLKNGQRGVHILEHTNNSILTLDGVFGTFQRANRIEWTENIFYT